MACEVNISGEEWVNAVKYRQNPFKVTPQQRVEQTLANLESIQEMFNLEYIKEKDRELYTLVGSDVYLAHRASDAYAADYKRRNPYKQETAESERRGNIVKAGGTLMHEANQAILDFYADGKGSLPAIKAKYSKKLGGEKNVDNLIKGVKDEVYDKAVAMQNEIDPEGTFTIKTEYKIVNPKNGVGGTMDVVVFFSDNTAMLFDYKGITPTFRKKKNGKLIRDLIFQGARDKYNLQQKEYIQALKLIGVKDVRGARIVPVRMDYKTEKNGRLLDEITKIELGQKQSKHLTQFPVIPETGKYEGVNDFVQAQLEHIDRLRQKLTGLSDKTERDKIIARMDKISRSVQEITINSNIKSIGEDLQELVNYINKNIDDISKDDLILHKEELTFYSNIYPVFADYIADVKKEDKKQGEKLEIFLKTLTGDAAFTKGLVEKTIETKAKELLNQKYIGTTGEVKPTKQPNIFQEMFSRLSEFKNPIFIAFTDLLNKAYFKMRRASKAEAKRITDKWEKVRKWGKANGVTNNGLVDLFFNKKTGNYYNKYSAEFWEERAKALTDKDIKWFNKYYELNDTKENIKEKIKKEREAYREHYKKVYLNNLEETYERDSDGKIKKTKDGKKIVKRTKENLKAELVKEMNIWDSKYDIFKGKGENRMSVENSRHFKINQEASKSFESAEYKRIEQTPELKEWYDFVMEFNDKYRKMLGLKYGEMPTNFFPNVRKEMIEKLTSSGISGFIKGGAEVFDNLSIREEDVYIGARDSNTGETIHQVPIFFINPYKTDQNGNHNEKSYDVVTSMLLFSKMANRYQYMNEIEADVNSLKTLLSTTKVIPQSSRGMSFVDKYGRKLLSKIGYSTTEAKLFQDQIDYHLYGVRFKGEGKTVNILGKEINLKKGALEAKKYHAQINLAASILPAIGAWIHGQMGVRIEGSKGAYYTKKQYRDAVKYISLNPKEAYKLAEDLELFTEETLDKLIFKSKSKKRKFADPRTWFIGLLKADENIDIVLAYSMLQNYGFDKNGNLRRLENLPEGTSPVINIETGKLQENLTDQQLIDIRNAVKDVAIKVKGATSEDDISAASTNMWTYMLMAYKTWMPGMLEERFGGLYYSERTDNVNIGRFTAMYNDILVKTPELSVIPWFTKIVVPAAMNIGVELATFGLLSPYSNVKKGVLDKRGISSSRMKRMMDKYNAFIAENPELIDTVTPEQFILANQRQLKGAMQEIRVALGFMMLYSVLTMKEDEGDWEITQDVKEAIASLLGGELSDDPFYAQYGWLGRILYRIFNRTSSELAFTMNPLEFANIAERPIPLLALFLHDIPNLAGNTIDEIGDVIFGEDSNRDRAEQFHYTTRMIRGGRQIRKILDMLWEADLGQTR